MNLNSTEDNSPTNVSKNELDTNEKRARATHVKDKMLPYSDDDVYGDKKRRTDTYSGMFNLNNLASSTNHLAGRFAKKFGEPPNFRRITESIPPCPVKHGDNMSDVDKIIIVGWNMAYANAYLGAEVEIETPAAHE